MTYWIIGACVLWVTSWIATTLMICIMNESSPRRDWQMTLMFFFLWIVPLITTIADNWHLLFRKDNTEHWI